MSDDGVGPLLAGLAERLAPADIQAALFGGDDGRRQPVHTVYVPAQFYDVHLVHRYGELAANLLDRHAPDGAALAAVTGLPVESAQEILPRVRAKLAEQPIEDLRVDFEDGYGRPGDEVEDTTATAAGTAIAEAALRPCTPLLYGIRIKSLERATRARAVRTLDLVLAAMLAADGLPERFVVTVPKVTHVAEAEAMVWLCEQLEARHGLPAGRLRFELQIEMPQAVVGPDGAATLARMVHACGGRCEGLHYGTYDFSAAAGVAAGQQSLEHPLADQAKAVMQLAAAGTSVRVSDGSTNVVPHGDPDAVHRAWGLHFRLVTRALRNGLYQGWDLHPGQLPTRYAATYAFLRGELHGAGADRLRAYVDRCYGGVLDEPATAQALAAGVLRGLDCGATDAGEVRRATGLDRVQLERLVRREPVGEPVA